MEKDAGCVGGIDFLWCLRVLMVVERWLRPVFVRGMGFLMDSNENFIFSMANPSSSRNRCHLDNYWNFQPPPTSLSSLETWKFVESYFLTHKSFLHTQIQRIGWARSSVCIVWIPRMHKIPHRQLIMQQIGSADGSTRLIVRRKKLRIALSSLSYSHTSH